MEELLILLFLLLLLLLTQDPDANRTNYSGLQINTTIQNTVRPPNHLRLEHL